MKVLLIFVNVCVLMMDDSMLWVEVFVVGGNRIIVIGLEEVVFDYVCFEMCFIDCNGVILMLGFVESYVYFFFGVYGQILLQFLGVKGFDVLKEGFFVFVVFKFDEGLFFVQGIDYEIFGKGIWFDCYMFDCICFDWLIVVMVYDFYMFFVNMVVLKVVGFFYGCELLVGNEVVMGEDGLVIGELCEKFVMLLVFDLCIMGGCEMLGMFGIELLVVLMVDEWCDDVEILK